MGIIIVISVALLTVAALFLLAPVCFYYWFKWLDFWSEKYKTDKQKKRNKNAHY